MQKKHQLQVKSLQENYEIKIKLIVEEKDKQIEKLQLKIENLDKINSELTLKLEDNIKAIYNIKDSCSSKLDLLERDLNVRDEELIKVRDNYERRINDIERNNEEDKKRIIFEYESKIEKMLRGFEEGRENLAKLIREKDKDINSLLERHEEDLKEFNKINSDLKSEIECHKQHIISSKNKKFKNKNLKINFFNILNIFFNFHFEIYTYSYL